MEKLKLKCGKNIDIPSGIGLFNFLSGKLCEPFENLLELAEASAATDSDSPSIVSIAHILSKSVENELNKFVEAIEKTIGEVEIHELHEDVHEGDIHRGIERIEEGTIVGVTVWPNKSIEGERVFLPIDGVIQYRPPDLAAQKRMKDK